MVKKKIIYIGNFDNNDTRCQLLTQPSGNTKIKYIIDALTEAGFIVSFYSTAVSSKNETLKKECYKYDGYEINYMLSVGHSSVFRRILSQLLVYSQLLFLLLFLNREQLVLVYHTPQLSKFISFIRKAKHFHLLYEIEENYAIVRHLPLKEINKEKELFKYGEGFIFVNDLIGNLYHLSSFPNVTCYGIYKFPLKKERNIDPSAISIVYAGGIDSDADLAVEVVRLLPSNYTLFVLGYGIQERIDSFLKKVLDDEVLNKRVKYLGCLSGDEYSKFLDKCDIGLSTRYVNKMDSQYAFPSKIMVYLSHNLLTISTPHEAILHSSVTDCVCFSDDFTAESIAKCIEENVEMKRNIENTERLKSMHDQFVLKLKDLVNEI